MYWLGLITGMIVIPLIMFAVVLIKPKRGNGGYF